KIGAGSGLPFSPAVKAGNFVYVSGSLATDEKGRVVPGTIQEQTKGVLNHLGAVLKASGTRLENAASVNVPATREISRRRLVSRSITSAGQSKPRVSTGA